MKKRPTMKDVSAHANVSLFTVSRALTGGDGISETTRAHVRKIADDLGYIPNQIARGLRGGTTKTIGVLTANTNNLYYATLVNSMEHLLQEQGYHCMVTDAVLDGEYRRDREDAFVEDLLQHQVAAVILTYQITTANIALLQGRGVEMIFVDTVPPEGFEHYPSVNSDNYAGAHALAEHMVWHGYPGPWAVVAFTDTWNSRVQRVRGFVETARNAGKDVDVIEGHNDSLAAYRAVLDYVDERIASGERMPRVVFTANELLLQGTLRALGERGIRVPWDVAIVSYDDFIWAPYIEPAVTVIDQRVEEVGRQAAATLLQRLHPESADLVPASVPPGDADEAGAAADVGDRVIVPTRLIVRRSCGCPEHRTGVGASGSPS